MVNNKKIFIIQCTLYFIAIILKQVCYIISNNTIRGIVTKYINITKMKVLNCFVYNIVSKK